MAASGPLQTVWDLRSSAFWNHLRSLGLRIIAQHANPMTHRAVLLQSPAAPLYALCACTNHPAIRCTDNPSSGGEGISKRALASVLSALIHQGNMVRQYALKRSRVLPQTVTALQSNALLSNNFPSNTCKLMHVLPLPTDSPCLSSRCLVCRVREDRQLNDRQLNDRLVLRRLIAHGTPQHQPALAHRGSSYANTTSSVPSSLHEGY